jgi:hypothetical protein
MCKQLVNRPTNALFVGDVHGKTNDYGLLHLIWVIIKMYGRASDPVLYPMEGDFS